MAITHWIFSVGLSIVWTHPSRRTGQGECAQGSQNADDNRRPALLSEQEEGE